MIGALRRMPGAGGFGGEGLRVLEDEGLGRFAEDLPPAGVEALLAELEMGSKFTTWAGTRDVGPVTPIEQWPLLRQLLAARCAPPQK